VTIDLERVEVSAHARRAMAERNVTPQQVLDALRYPEITEPHLGRRRYVRGDVAVVVDDRGGRHVVVTVLWRRGDQWTSETMAARA